MWHKKKFKSVYFAEIYRKYLSLSPLYCFALFLSSRLPSLYFCNSPYTDDGCSLLIATGRRCRNTIEVHVDDTCFIEVHVDDTCFIEVHIDDTCFIEVHIDDTYFIEIVDIALPSWS